MFGVECFDTHDEPISHYTQWDINQTLKIVLHGMDAGYMKNAPYVHFANIKSSEALVVPSTLQGDNTIIVDIPNILLQAPWPLLVYVYLSDSTDASSQRTIVKIEIPVHKRARPSDYEYVENIDRITAEAIKQEVYDDIMDEVHGGNIAYPYVTFIDESTGKHVNLKVSDEKFGLYVDSTNRQLLDTGDIVNNLMTDSSTKVLSASMGAAIKNMVDVIPDNIDEKIEEHDSSPTSHSDIRDDISSVSSAVDTMQDSIAEIENKIDDAMLDDTISGSGILTTTDALVDSSPIEMRIKGATRQNLWVNPSGTKGGVTCTSNADGSMTISGTSKSNSVSVNSPYSYILKPSTTYTVSCDKKIDVTVGASCFTILEIGSDGSKLTYHDFAYSNDSHPTTVTFTTQPNAAYYQFRLYASGDTTVSGTYRVMLNEGSEAEPWCPPGLNSVDELSLVTAGKNLNGVAEQIEHVRWALSAEPGWGEKRAELLELFNSLPDGEYTFSCKCRVESVAPESAADPASYDLAGLTVRSSEGPLHPCTVRATVGVSQVGDVFEIVQPVEISSGTYMGRYDELYVYSPGADVGYRSISTFYDIQLELGSTATDYEPPAVTTTPIDLQGHTLNSLPDGTHDELTIDATGAVTLTKRVGSVTLSSDAGDWKKDAAGSRYSMRISPEAHDPYTPGSVVSDALPYRRQWDHSYTGTHIMAVAGATYASVGTDETAQDIADVCGGKKLLYPLATPQTIPLTAVTLPSFPSDKSNIYTTSNIPTAGLTVRYWKKGGELVANLYKLLRNHEA